MKLVSAVGGLFALALTLAPMATFAQDVGISGSPLPDQPYTLFYPAIMVTGGEVGGPLTINHPEMPLQCVLAVVPVEDTDWTADDALASLDTASVTAGWNQTLPGFALAASKVTAYQSNPALQYEGQGGPEAETGPVTLVHTETVTAGHGYTLDCFYPTALADQARPIVDAIIANFSTQQDADPISPMP